MPEWTADAHMLSAFTPMLAFRQVMIHLKVVNRFVAFCFIDDGVNVMEAIQAGRDMKESC